LYAGDLTILATSPSRKEMWKSGGLVRLSPGDLEARKAVLDEQWSRLNEEQEDGEVGKSTEQGSVKIYNDDDPLDRDGDEDGGDEEEAEDDSDEDEAPRGPLPILHKVKRKREIELTASRPIKKVAFAPASKGSSSKHSRTAGLLDQISTKRVVQTRSPVDKKVANVMTKTKRIQTADDEAYDFSSFF
jgi:nuclear GTP-binding protein